MSSITIFIPIILFLFALVFLSLKTKTSGGSEFLKSYFLGDQNLKGFVLAMTLVATYGSVSSFVSGPGVAWRHGLGWVVFAAPQIIAGFLVLGVLGKKMALVSRRISAVTVIDVVFSRYRSHSLAVLLSVLLLVFFTTMMVGQFIGGAQIVSQAAGIDYQWGLLIFGLVVVLYTAFGGFRAVVITDTLCAILMLVGMFSLAQGLLSEAGGLTNLMTTIGQSSEGEKLLSPTSAGALPLSLLFSAWILVGFATVALPQSVVRCMAYKNTQDLHLAMIVSTVVCGALMIGMTFLGVLARGVIVDAADFGGNTDAMIPYLISHHMSPWMAGVTLIGPLAATMSTVSSLLIAASSAIIKDLLLRRYNRKPDEDKSIQSVAKIATLILGVVALVLAMYPIDIIVWINMFAFGGLELAFLCPLVGGLFWRRATFAGAMTSVLCGLGLYFAIVIFKIPTFGWHAVAPAMLVSILSFIGVSLITKNSHSLNDFFAH